MSRSHLPRSDLLPECGSTIAAADNRGREFFLITHYHVECPASMNHPLEDVMLIDLLGSASSHEDFLDG